MTVLLLLKKRHVKKNDVQARITAHALPMNINLPSNSANSTNNINIVNPEGQGKLLSENWKETHLDGSNTAGYDKSKDRMFQLSLNWEILAGNAEEPRE
ncbi:hypothetical protein Tco_0620043 [Tanacetum coccineum]